MSLMLLWPASTMLPYDAVQPAQGVVPPGTEIQQDRLALLFVPCTSGLGRRMIRSGIVRAMAALLRMVVKSPAVGPPWALAVLLGLVFSCARAFIIMLASPIPPATAIIVRI